MSLTSDGLHYDVRGGDGPPLLFVHGFPLSSEMWRPAAAALLEDWDAHAGPRPRVLLPDLRGMGQSPPLAATSMASYADDLAALLDGVAARGPLTLIALSMGGYIALEFLRRYAGRAARLALCCTRAAADAPQAAADRRTLADRVLREGAAVVAAAYLPKLFGPHAPDALKADWDARMSATSPLGVAAGLRAMADRPDSTPTLKSIAVPTLVIAGEHDVITPPAEMQQMAAQIPAAQYFVMPGVGHLAPLEQPRAFARKLRDFLTPG